MHLTLTPGVQVESESGLKLVRREQVNEWRLVPYFTHIVNN